MDWLLWYGPEGNFSLCSIEIALGWSFFLLATDTQEKKNQRVAKNSDLKSIIVHVKMIDVCLICFIRWNKTK